MRVVGSGQLSCIARIISKSFRALGVVISVILKILVRFGNDCAFYFEIFEIFGIFERENHFVYCMGNCESSTLCPFIRTECKNKKIDTFLCSCRLGDSGS